MYDLFHHLGVLCCDELPNILSPVFPDFSLPIVSHNQDNVPLVSPKFCQWFLGKNSLFQASGIISLIFVAHFFQNFIDRLFDHFIVFICTRTRIAIQFFT